MTTKSCSGCRIERPLSSFSRDKTRPGGIYPRCGECRKAYYRNNGERERSKMKSYRERHRTLLVERQKQYAKRRFFWKTAGNLKLRSSGLSASFIKLARLWKSQRGLCAMTKRRLTRFNAQIDHITPLVKGGSGDISNLRWVHRDANYAKRDLSDAEFIALCREVTANSTKHGI